MLYGYHGPDEAFSNVVIPAIPPENVEMPDTFNVAVLVNPVTLTLVNVETPVMLAPEPLNNVAVIIPEEIGFPVTLISPAYNVRYRYKFFQGAILPKSYLSARSGFKLLSI